MEAPRSSRRDFARMQPGEGGWEEITSGNRPGAQRDMANKPRNLVEAMGLSG